MNLPQVLFESIELESNKAYVKLIHPALATKNKRDRFFKVVTIMCLDEDLCSTLASAGQLDLQDILKISPSFAKVHVSPIGSSESVVFEATENPQHLSFFSLVVFDRSVDPNLDLPRSMKISSIPTVELAIASSQAVTESGLFRDPRGNIFSGPVLREGTIFRRADTNEVLVANFFPNATLRTRALSLRRLEALKGKLTPPTGSSKARIFSELWLARDGVANARMAFSFDHKKFLELYSTSGFLLNSANKNKIDQILSLSPIRQMTIFRQLVTEDETLSRLAMPTTDLSRVEKSEDKYIVHGGDARPGIFSSFDSSSESTIREMESNVRDRRLFTILDTQASRISGGKHRYRVDIVMENGISKFLKEISDSLVVSIQDLESLRTKSLAPSNFANGDYTPAYKQRFEVNSQKYNTMALHIRDTLARLYDDVRPEDSTIIFNAMSPSAGRLRDLEKLISILNALVGEIESSIKDSSPKDLVRHSHNFNQFFDSSSWNNSGVDYLDERNLKITRSDGLRVITGEEYQQRAQIETRMFFNVEDADVEISSSAKSYSSPGVKLSDASFTYLSPMFIKIQQEYVDTHNWNGENHGKVLMRFLDGGRGIAPTVSEFYAQNNFVVSQTFDIKAMSVFLKSKNIEFSKVFGDDFPHNFSEEEQVRFITKRMESEVDSKFLSTGPEAKSFDLRAETNILDRLSISKREVDLLPNQWKSLFLGSLRSTLVRDNPLVNISDQTRGSLGNSELMATPLFKINYGLIGKVEVLVGLDDNQKEDWQPLTLSLYNDLVGSDIVCRIRKYTGGIFNIELSGLEKIQLFNTIFIIRSENRTPESESAAPTIAPMGPQIIPRLSIPSANLNSGVFNVDSLISPASFEQKISTFWL